MQIAAALIAQPGFQRQFARRCTRQSQERLKKPITCVVQIMQKNEHSKHDVYLNCRPPLLLFNVYVILCVAITCYIMSFVGAIAWTLPWWSELYEWVSGLVVYGLVTDVLSVIAGALLLIVIHRQGRAIRSRESDLARRQPPIGRDIVGSSAR